MARVFYNENFDLAFFVPVTECLPRVNLRDVICWKSKSHGSVALIDANCD